MKKRGILVGIIFFSMLIVGGAVYAETISISLEAGPYEILKDQDGFDTISMEGYTPTGAPGNPLLPVRVFNILVPPDIVWDSLEFTIMDSEGEMLAGMYTIRPAAPDVASVDGKLIYAWGVGSNIIDGKNMDIYGIDAFFPAQYVQLLPYSQMRKWKYTRVEFFPFQYNPVTGQLTIVKKLQIAISFERSADKTSPALLMDRVMDHLAPELFYNYESGKGWYAPPESSEVPNAPDHDYVIITTNAIESGSTKLANFVARKQARGHSVLVVTEDDFGPLTGQAPNQRAEKIRQWLINNYSAEGIQYVLLIGDPTPGGSGTTAIPMKMCWPRYGEISYQESPTDAFYADLTGNWDLDGDQYYGEWSDYTGSGGVDFSMEVWVGRVPVYGTDYTTLDNILQKIMDYENERTISWRESILLPMGFQAAGYDGAPLSEQMRDDYLNSRSYTSWRQYQQGSGACGVNSIYTSEQELRGGTIVRDRWAANDYGIVCWWGHGSATSTSVGYDGCWDGTLFSNTQTSSLDDDHPSFTYQCSCTNGYPENTNNLQYAILKQGGIGTVSATRVSWFNTGVGYGQFDGSSTNSGIGYEYVNRLTQDLVAGRALYEGKLAVVPNLIGNTRLMNQYDFNLYGDPSTGLASAGRCPVSDFDGDGKTDVAIYRSNTGAWYVNPSGGGSPYGVGWGGDPNDIPVPGDFDGDGKSDVVVFRQSTGAWYVNPSGGGSPYGVGWGGDSTDIPAPFDYDGDGKSDIAVYRRSTGAWYIYPSGGGSPYGVGWGGGANDVPVNRVGIGWWYID